MDSLHAIGFYVSATLLSGGAILVALLPSREMRGLAFGGVGLGLAGVDFSLSAGFAGIVALVCYGTIALVVAAPGYRAVVSSISSLWRQVAAVGAACLFAIAAYSAFRGDFVHANFYGGPFGGAAIGRLLFTHDALATESIGALVLIALVGATSAWRHRERSR